jgi:hypothetical protein
MVLHWQTCATIAQRFAYAFTMQFMGEFTMVSGVFGFGGICGAYYYQQSGSFL